MRMKERMKYNCSSDDVLAISEAWISGGRSEVAELLGLTKTQASSLIHQKLRPKCGIKLFPNMRNRRNKERMYNCSNDDVLAISKAWISGGRSEVAELLDITKERASGLIQRLILQCPELFSNKRDGIEVGLIFVDNKRNHHIYLGEKYFLSKTKLGIKRSRPYKQKYRQDRKFTVEDLEREWKVHIDEIDALVADYLELAEIKKQSLKRKELIIGKKQDKILIPTLLCLIHSKKDEEI